MSYNNDILKIFRSNLHLGPLDRIVAVFPVVPVHSFTIDLTIEVQTIQIGVVTSVVPPGALSSCRSCFLFSHQVFYSSIFPRETSERFRYFVLTTKKTNNLVPRFSRLTECAVLWQLCYFIFRKILPILPTVAGCNELCVGFQPITKGEIF